ncbi:MAG: hypothetical protein ACR2JO_01365 [Mycobacteriales bacterium]
MAAAMLLAVAALAAAGSPDAVAAGSGPGSQTGDSQRVTRVDDGAALSGAGGPGRVDPAGVAGFHVLWGVAAITRKDAVAVGEGGGDLSVRARHWDGTGWAPTHPPGGPISEMFGVAAISRTDVWGVGDFQSQALANHWDGTGWTRVPTPTPDQYTRDIFHGVGGASSGDVWAVGYTESGQTGEVTPLIEHWNGSAWTKTPYRLPYGNTYGVFDGVTALSATDAWAVGVTYPYHAPLIEHWDGRRWTPVTGIASPTSVGIDRLRAVTAVSPTDIWAVGTSGGGRRTAILHWDGRQWTQLPSPNGSGDLNQLLGVTAVSADDVWAVGTSGPFGQMTGRTLILHWNGQRWTKVPSPNPGRTNNGLFGVSATGHSDAWAVGILSNNLEDSYVHLYLRWDGTSWTRQRA